MLKWDIVDRWVRQDSELAAARFEEMTETGLGDYANLFERELH